MLLNEIPEAVEAYREVLRSCDDHSKDFRTDPLPKIHTLHNLNEILQEKKEKISPTLRDEKLLKELKELKEKYLKKTLLPLETCRESFEKIRQSVTLLLKEVIFYNYYELKTSSLNCRNSNPFMEIQSSHKRILCYCLTRA